MSNDFNGKISRKYVIDNVVMTFEGLNMASRQMDELFRDSFLDLPVLYKVPINEDESSFIVVSMHNLVTFGIDEDELREAAKRNTFSKTVVIDLKNGIAASMCEGISGAVIMTSKDSMRNLSERFYCGGGFYIIPSSIYEIITAPVREDTDDERSNLLEILKEGNKTLVEKEEILSYSLYRYYSDDEEVKIEC